MPICKECRARIQFIKTPAGNWLPANMERLQARDCAKGTVIVTSAGYVVNIKRTKEERLLEGFIAHWATCPYADKFRQPKMEEVAK